MISELLCSASKALVTLTKLLPTRPAKPRTSIMHSDSIYYPMCNLVLHHVSLPNPHSGCNLNSLCAQRHKWANDEWLNGNWTVGFWRQWRPVSTQENKHRIGHDFFSILYYPHRRTKKSWKYFNSIIRVGYHGLNWNRKLVPKAHACAFKFVPIRSDPMLIFLSGNHQHWNNNGIFWSMDNEIWYGRGE